MNQELKILHHILNNPSWYKWQAPIASLIPHDPTFIAWGDSSLYACGGYSYDLKIWWYFSMVLLWRCLWSLVTSRGEDPVTTRESDPATQCTPERKERNA